VYANLREGKTVMGDAVQRENKQLLHLVYGGELLSLVGVEFQDVEKLDVVGIYAKFAEAEAAWRGAAQRTVDNALMRYFIVHIHRLIDPVDLAPKS